MKGPKGLASESDWRRCRTAKAITPMGKGELLRSTPRNCRPRSAQTVSRRNRRTRREARRVTPPSDVTSRAEASANLGRTVAAGVVLRCEDSGRAPRGHPRDSNAAVWECGPSRSRGRDPRERARFRASEWQGSHGLVRCSGGAEHDDDERADECFNPSQSRVVTRSGRGERIPPRGGPWTGGKRGHARVPRKGILAWRLNGDATPEVRLEVQSDVQGKGDRNRYTLGNYH